MAGKQQSLGPGSMIPPCPPATTCFSGKKRSHITQENKEGGRQDKEQEMSLRRKPGATDYKYPSILVFSIKSLLERVRRTRCIYVMFIMKQNEEQYLHSQFLVKRSPSVIKEEFRIQTMKLGPKTRHHCGNNPDFYGTSSRQQAMIWALHHDLLL